MAEYWLKFLDYIVYTMELVWVGESLFHNRVREWKRYVIVIFVYSVTMLLIGAKWLLAVTALEMATYIFLFQGKLTQKLVCFFKIYLVTGVVDVLLGGILSLIPNELFRYNTTSGEFISTIMSAVLVCSIVKKKWFQNFFEYLHLLKWFQYIAILIIIVSCISLLVTSEFVLSLIESSRVSATFYAINVILFGAIIGGIIWLVYGVYKTDYYFKQNQLKNEIIDAQQQYYQNIYESDKEMRSFRHDIKSQLGCLNLLLEEGKTEQALTYLKSLEDNFNSKVAYKYYVGDEVLDAVINYKYSQISQKDIVLNVKGKISKGKSIDIYDLCTIFSNAISNAIEACEKVSGVKKIVTI